MKEQFQKKALSLLNHADPGVRGYAAEASANFARSAPDSALMTKLEAMLQDENPFARANAAKALGILRSAKSIPLMMPLLDDKDMCIYDIRGWKNLEGREDKAHHDCSAWSIVNDAVVQAIAAASSGMGADAFRAEMVNLKTKDSDIARNIAATRAWYEAHKGSL